MKIKKIHFIMLTITIGWYLCLYLVLGSMGSGCSCPTITEDTYLGPNWPTLFYMDGCGDCGLPESPSQFFLQILATLTPAGLTYLFYRITKKYNKKRKITSKYSFTISLGIIGLVLGILIYFFISKNITAYVINILFTIIILGLFGLGLDFKKNKKRNYMWLSFLLAVILFINYAFFIFDKFNEII